MEEQAFLPVLAPRYLSRTWSYPRDFHLPYICTPKKEKQLVEYLHHLSFVGIAMQRIIKVKVLITLSVKQLK